MHKDKDLSHRVLCRGKDIVTNRWIDGFYMQLLKDNKRTHYILTGKSNLFYGSGTARETFEKFEVYPETVGMFTGYYDDTPWKELTKQEQQDWLNADEKNSKESWWGQTKAIWEDDILQCQIGQDTPQFSKVYYHRGDFVIEYNGDIHNLRDFIGLVKKRGNIHDNPHLIEKLIEASNKKLEEKLLEQLLTSLIK